MPLVKGPESVTTINTSLSQRQGRTGSLRCPTSPQSRESRATAAAIHYRCRTHGSAGLGELAGQGEQSWGGSRIQGAMPASGLWWVGEQREVWEKDGSCAC